MARVIQFIEIDLNGASFQLALGGCIALCERTFIGVVIVAVIRVNTLQEAERLETLANASHATFFWRETYRPERENAISVDDFEKQVTADPKRFFPKAAWDRLGIKDPEIALERSPQVPSPPSVAPFSADELKRTPSFKPSGN